MGKLRKPNTEILKKFRRFLVLSKNIYIKFLCYNYNFTVQNFEEKHLSHRSISFCLHILLTRSELRVTSNKYVNIEIRPSRQKKLVAI